MNAPLHAPIAISPIQDIVADMKAGRMVILIDEEDRENEGDLVLAADHVSAEAINFMARYGRGLICLTLTRERCERLQLPPMVSRNGTKHATAFTVSIEAAEGVTTGISAADRARTVQAAVAPHAKASDLVQPGHVFPLQAVDGGVLMRAGHTEAGCDLTHLAGLTPAAVICEIMNDDGSMARLPDLIPFARQHGLKTGTIADLIHYRAANESMIERVGQCAVRTVAGDFELCVYRDKPSGSTHLALVHGTIDPARETLVRVHEPTSLLDFIDVEKSSHSWTFARALQAIAAAGSGVVVLLNCGESPAQLLERAREFTGASSVLAARPTRMDLRTYGVGAQILRDLSVGRMKLLARPRKMPSMAGFGLHTTGYLEA
jgi:3,4-dihydroxy 2-butanone 4-phosphate synthase/GTP cyclohydrolase II